MSKSKNTIVKLYAGQLKNWPKSAGAKLLEVDLVNAGAACALINKRVGGIEYLAVAMYLRPMGATQGQVQAGCKSGTAVNVYHRLVSANVCTARHVEPRSDVKGGRSHKVYALAMPAPRKGKGKGTKAPTPTPSTPATS